MAILSHGGQFSLRIQAAKPIRLFDALLPYNYVAIQHECSNSAEAFHGKDARRCLLHAAAADHNIQEPKHECVH